MLRTCSGDAAADVVVDEGMSVVQPTWPCSASSCRRLWQRLRPPWWIPRATLCCRATDPLGYAACCRRDTGHVDQLSALAPDPGTYARHQRRGKMYPTPWEGTRLRYPGGDDSRRASFLLADSAFVEHRAAARSFTSADSGNFCSAGSRTGRGWKWGYAVRREVLWERRMSTALSQNTTALTADFQEWITRFAWGPSGRGPDWITERGGCWCWRSTAHHGGVGKNSACMCARVSQLNSSFVI